MSVYVALCVSVCVCVHTYKYLRVYVCVCASTKHNLFSGIASAFSEDSTERMQTRLRTYMNTNIRILRVYIHVFMRLYVGRKKDSIPGMHPDAKCIAMCR